MGDDQMKKMLPTWLSIVLAAGLLVTGGLMILPSAIADDTVSTSSSLELFLDVFSRTSTTYVDSVESQALIEAALQGMLESLDPNSMLLNPEDYENLTIQITGSFEGVGIAVGLRDDWLTVISPIEGTPAYRAGMKAGDRIVEINGESTFGLSTNEGVMQIRGPGGSTVDLTVVRPGVTDSLTFCIERDVIDFPSVSAAFKLDDETGYIRLSRFGEETAEEFEEQLDSLVSEGALRIILDLRGNAGGLFSAAVDIADLFLPAGALVVSTNGYSMGENRYLATSGEFFEGEVAVLVDGGSASSSEILAGALQDHGVATLIGSRTFGKGSVQTLMDLGEFPNIGHYAVKLTTARYFTPDGRCIDRTLEDDFYESADDSLQDWGILPDLTIESPELSGDIAVELLAGSMFFKFANQYILDHEIGLDFWPDSIVMTEFQLYLDEQEFEWDIAEFQANIYYIEKAVFSELAVRNRSGEEYHRMMAPHDETIQRALELFSETN